jgi:hypothetical protein
MSSTAGLLDSKWAVPSLDVLTARRARGLHGTFREEQEEVSEMKSRPFRIIWAINERKDELVISITNTVSYPFET